MFLPMTYLTGRRVGMSSLSMSLLRARWAAASLLTPLRTESDNATRMDTGTPLPPARTALPLLVSIGWLE